ncbi:hypothetical protein FA15DRAFT_661650 [Coprinopsis marcescibilis]|uniref:Uncharacterized protein n=1 Tax=Coprinopsis marcescibilis TaxID=230819 RepID=A0A5C3KB23_COPMA|nr:hypothetical protein FA15DRAFT_661650 [Coprinopsis marcescibilis]
MYSAVQLSSLICLIQIGKGKENYLDRPVVKFRRKHFGLCRFSAWHTGIENAKNKMAFKGFILHMIKLNASSELDTLLGQSLPSNPTTWATSDDFAMMSPRAAQ